MRRIRDANVQRLRVGVPGFSYDLEERQVFFEEYQRRYPRTRLEFHGGHSVELLEMLCAHEVDAAIVRAPFNSQGLDTLLINRSFGSLLVPVESELAALEEVGLDQLKGQRLAVLPRRLSQLWDITYAPFIDAGMELVEIAEGHRHAVLHHAHRQRLFVLTWQWPHEQEYCAEDLVHRPFANFQPVRDSYVVKESDASNATLERFWSVAKDLFPHQPSFDTDISSPSDPDLLRQARVG
jgi:DNA-binding transcriptional LysR family regulator